MITAILHASGSAKVNPYTAFRLALILIGPLLIMLGSVKHIKVLPINSPIPARNGYKGLPIPCNELRKTKRAPKIKYNDISQYVNQL